MKTKTLAALTLAALPAIASAWDCDGNPQGRAAVSERFDGALWITLDHFVISTQDNGRNLDELARHACSVIYKHGLRGERVRVEVVDPDLSREFWPGKWFRLGTARCD